MKKIASGVVLSKYILSFCVFGKHIRALTFFCLTKKKAFMRIHPVLLWTFQDVWGFLRGFNLRYKL